MVRSICSRAIYFKRSQKRQLKRLLLGRPLVKPKRTCFQAFRLGFALFNSLALFLTLNSAVFAKENWDKTIFSIQTPFKMQEEDADVIEQETRTKYENESAPILGQLLSEFGGSKKAKFTQVPYSTLNQRASLTIDDNRQNYYNLVQAAQMVEAAAAETIVPNEAHGIDINMGISLDKEVEIFAPPSRNRNMFITHPAQHKRSPEENQNSPLLLLDEDQTWLRKLKSNGKRLLEAVDGIVQNSNNNNNNDNDYNPKQQQHRKTNYTFERAATNESLLPLEASSSSSNRSDEEGEKNNASTEGYNSEVTNTSSSEISAQIVANNTQMMMMMMMINETDVQNFTKPANVCRSHEDIIRDMPHITFRITLASIYLSIFIMGLTGNSLTLYALYKKGKKRDIIDIFIANLALSDIMLCLVSVPITPLYSLYYGHWTFGVTLCKLLAFVMSSSVYISTITLVNIAYIRYRLIVHPHKTPISRSTAKKMNIFAWCLSFAITLPYVYYVGLTPEKAGCTYEFCDETWGAGPYRFYFSLATLMFQFVSPFSSVSYFYGSVFLTLRRKTMRFNDLEQKKELQLAPAPKQVQTEAFNNSSSSSKHIAQQNIIIVPVHPIGLVITELENYCQCKNNLKATATAANSVPTQLETTTKFEKLDEGKERDFEVAQSPNYVAEEHELANYLSPLRRLVTATLSKSDPPESTTNNETHNANHHHFQVDGDRFQINEGLVSHEKSTVNLMDRLTHKTTDQHLIKGPAGDDNNLQIKKELDVTAAAAVEGKVSSPSTINTCDAEEEEESVNHIMVCDEMNVVSSEKSNLTPSAIHNKQTSSSSNLRRASSLVKINLSHPVAINNNISSSNTDDVFVRELNDVDRGRLFGGNATRLLCLHCKRIIVNKNQLLEQDRAISDMQLNIINKQTLTSHTKNGAKTTTTATTSMNEMNAIRRNKNHERTKRQTQTNRKLVCMVALFACAWLPLNLFNVASDSISAISESEYVRHAFIVVHAIACFSVCFNPFLYAWMSDNYRQELRNILPKHIATFFGV